MLSLVFTCTVCGKPATTCPMCTNAILIDPETNIPPDVMPSGRGFKQIEPTPEAMARSIKKPVCDDCILQANEIHGGNIETSKSRHDRGFCQNLGDSEPTGDL